jgi:hypothetical protein
MKMAYEAEITTANPGCFLFLIDQSGSMGDRIADKPGGKTKAQGVADAINDLLNDLVAKCTRPDGVRDYFDVGVIGYAEKALPAFTGVLANRDLVPLSEVAKYRSGGKSNDIARVPISFGPVAKGDTAMCAALKRAHEVLEDWVRRHSDSYPPIVINITDGDAKDGDPVEPARYLAGLSTKDGNVLVFNCHISAEKGKPILFPYDEKGLPGYAPRLFKMSSILPPKFREVAKTLGFEVVNDTRGFAFNAELTDVVKFLDLGKHTLMAQLGAGAQMLITASSAPVTMGKEITYNIKVTDQSVTSDLHHMTIAGLIPAETTYVGADGPTRFTLVGREVRFEPVPTMKPRETVEFHIKVKAAKPGAAVFDATMRWDEFGEPIVGHDRTTIVNA